MVEDAKPKPPRKPSAARPAKPAAPPSPPGKGTAAADTPEVFKPVARPVADGRVWIDLLNPGDAEVAEAVGECGLRIPSREELSEIESSSRHYVENGALYLSAPLLTHAETKEPELTPVGFIVTRERLVTVRFDELRAFDAAAASAQSTPPASGLQAFTLVIEAVIDRQADVLELQGLALQELSREVFQPETGKKRNNSHFRELLRRVGEFNDRLAKLRGSLLAVGRLTPFVLDTSDGQLPPELEHRLRVAKEDVISLTAYAENLTGKTQFLLDAALGFINIDQNEVFRLLTVVSAVGVPPTLVASVYGMNFKVMPELEWPLGYPFAMALIVLSTVLPLLWFRKKGWF